MKCPKCQTNNPDTLKFCGECGTQLIPSEEISAPTETLEVPKEELTTGSTFAERYQIIEELGKGGMGEVYKVHDTEIKEKVALKLLNPEIAADKKTIERFRNEIKLARKIVHKNVGRMYDLGREQNIYYISMEYVPGEDLKSFIRRSEQLSVGKAITIAKQVCEGLQEAHRLGVVHRDLKPSNIMIDKEGNARIMDFGIARSLKAKGITGAGVMIGTPEYMSPEQVEVKEVDQRSDIYSLGVILYEMVTGRVPFEGETPFGIAMKHKSEIPKDPREINSQIPEDLSRVILRCMEKDKENRYQSAGEIRSELINIEKGIPTTEKVVPKRKPLTSREITVTLGLKKLFIPALVVVVLVIAAVLIWQILPKKEAVLAPKIENSIAVISFENLTGDNSYNYLQKAIPNLLITNLENTGYLYVATWERMLDLLKQIGKKDVEIIDRDSGFKLCRMEGIEAVVLGSFIKAGDMFATDVKILDVETKKLMKSTSSKGEGVESILRTQIDDLSKEISQGIGIAREKIEAVQVQITDATTSSMEAYKYYLSGREDLEKLYFDEARRFFQKAIEIDSTFAMAHFYLGKSYLNLGDSKMADEAYEEAKAFSEKATEKERLYIAAVYAKVIEEDPEKRFRILKQIAKSYPKEKQVYRLLGRYYWRDRKLYDKAIEEYNKALDLDPNYGDIFNEFGVLYYEIENFEKAIEYLEKYASAFPGDANPLDSIAWACFRMGKIDEAIKKFKEALEIKPDFYWSLRGMHYITAFMENYPEAMKWADQYIDKAESVGRRAEGYIFKGFYQYWLGKLDQSLNSLRKGRYLAVEVGNWYRQYLTEWMKGLIYYTRGELELSQNYFKSSLDLAKEYSPQFISFYTAWYYFNLGLVELKKGQIDSAKSRLAEIKHLLTKMDPSGKIWRKIWITYLYDYLTGDVLLAQDSFDKTIEVLRKTSPVTIPSDWEDIIFYNLFNHKDVLARAYRQNGEIDKAIAEYESLIAFDQKSRKERLIYPKYHYWLAKLYEQKGWEGKAIEHYEKFLELWKDADPGIPEVEDAKKRLAALQNQQG